MRGWKIEANGKLLHVNGNMIRRPNVSIVYSFDSDRCIVVGEILLRAVGQTLGDEKSAKMNRRMA
jgi:hypothetical protein